MSEDDVPEPKSGEPTSDAQHDTFRWGVPISEDRQAWLHGRHSTLGRQGSRAAPPARRAVGRQG